MVSNAKCFLDPMMRLSLRVCMYVRENENPVLIVGCRALCSGITKYCSFSKFIPRAKTFLLQREKREREKDEYISYNCTLQLIYIFKVVGVLITAMLV